MSFLRTILFSCAAAIAQAAVPAIGEMMPPLGQDVKWLKGDPVPAFQKGHVYVIDIWGTWCAPCLAELPHMKELANRYRGKATVIAIAVSPEAGIPPAEFVNKKGDLMPYVVAQDIGDRIDARFDDGLGSLGAGGYPTLAIVDREGRLAFFGRGYPNPGFEESLASIVEGKYDLKSAVAQYRRMHEVKRAAEPLLERASSKDVNTAVEAVRKLVKLDAGLFALRAVNVYPRLREAGKERANQWARELVDELLTGSDFRLAWPLATLASSIAYVPDTMNRVRPDADATDFALALRAATRASEVAGNKDPWRVQTVAMIQFSSGDKAAGVTAMNRSVELAEAANWGEEELSKLRVMRDQFRRQAN